MEISFFDMKDQKEKSFFEKNLKNCKLNFFSEPIQEIPLNKLKNTEIAVVFIHSKVSKKILKQLPKLKLIITQSTGFDHIDTAFCKQNNIEVGFVPTYGENTVAEHTFALMLNLSRHVHKSYLRTKNSNFSIEGLRGFDLKGKTLGIFGTGHIGFHVIKIAKGFGMHVKAYDIKKDNFLSEVLHFEYAEIDEILKTSDIISLHMPLNKHTKHFINEEKIKKTKKGVIIINTSRGDLIETDALYKYLKNKHIAGAGLDVIEGEEYISHEDELINNSEMCGKINQVIKDKAIFNMENVIFTPHNAFNSNEAVTKIMQTTLENIDKFRKEKQPKYSPIKK